MDQVHRLSLRRTGFWLLILAAIGLWASADLSIERYLTLADPNYIPSCSFSLFIDCGPAMGSWQGRIFGFPNPFLGVGAFPVVMATGVIMLTGWEPPRWYWRALAVGTTLAMVLIVFLMWTSIYSLGRLCPYCMVVWTITIPLWWNVLAFGSDRGHLPGPARLRSTLVDYRPLLIVASYVAVILWIVIALWDTVLSEVQG
ncbi:vitamin K epoxide reductase family protein [Rarobacter faecitabidus]|uniref:vitamin K epoxide reductase family protein n=1 Tax=Rarobacter faecitabidus TaxID=13243 RepID=UPI001B8697C3|nr:vitamin K epoxide reductase family protein [Rarobacter faecitabidus]